MADWTRVESDPMGRQYVLLDEATKAIQEAGKIPSLPWPGWVMPTLLIVSFAVGLFALFAILAMLFRVVVSTNDVHIVQSAKRTVSYGKDQPAGNTYYKWPAWVPFIGVRVIVLPVSVFNVTLDGYAAYDKGRVPFKIDIMAFFRIKDSNVAAQRVASFKDLTDQLRGILQGAIRSILATSEIEEILEGRSQFGEKFTIAVDTQLEAWGVTNVKNIELMDIRDGDESEVIANIMAKKKSLIERQSRTEVAENIRAAKEAEIVAAREVNLRAQEAEQQVGQRTAEKDKQVGIAKQKAQQEIKEQEAVTATKTMAVKQIEQVRAAEIEREAKVVAADQAKKQTVIAAEGNLEQAKLHAQGVEVEGKARGEAEKAVLLAPVNAQITLAKEIGENQGYQQYLLGIKEIDKNQVVGVAQAQALQDAEIKVIANAGNVVTGVETVMDLLTTKGGTQIGSMLEGLAQTETGKAILKKVSA